MIALILISSTVTAGMICGFIFLPWWIGLIIAGAIIIGLLLAASIAKNYSESVNYLGFYSIIISAIVVSGLTYGAIFWLWWPMLIILAVIICSYLIFLRFASLRDSSSWGYILGMFLPISSVLSIITACIVCGFIFWLWWLMLITIIGLIVLLIIIFGIVKSIRRKKRKTN